MSKYINYLFRVYAPYARSKAVQQMDQYKCITKSYCWLTYVDDDDGECVSALYVYVAAVIACCVQLVLINYMNFKRVI